MVDWTRFANLKRLDTEMETEEIYNIPISSLVTTPFAVEWSPDNHISLITEKGVHIIEIIPSPMSTLSSPKISRSFIYPSDILPSQSFQENVESLLWKLKYEEINSLIMESAITPKINEFEDILPHIIKVSWSPCNLMHPSKCILAILTSTGTIELLHKVGTDWYSLCELSSSWLSIVGEEIKMNLENVNKMGDISRVKIIRTNLRRLQACAMTWSKLYESNQNTYAYFVTAYRNSEIAIWKVLKISPSTEKAEVDLVCKLNLNTDIKVTTLCWIDINQKEYLVLVGYFDGQIDGIKLQNEEQTLKRTSIKKYYSYADRMQVHSVCALSQNKCEIKVLLAKGSFLLQLSIQKTGELKSIRHIQLEGFTISGITRMNEERVLVTTQDAAMYIIDAVDDDLYCTKMMDQLPNARVQYLGLARSPMHEMFINVTSPNSTYDHLVIREPSTIYFFVFQSGEWDPAYIFKRSEEFRFERRWEFLELLRMKAIKSEDPMKVLPAVPEDLESLSIHDLRTSMWVSAITEICIQRRGIPGTVNIIGEISDAHPLIFLHSASEYLIRLSKKTDLSEDNKLSANLIRMYFEVHLAGEETGEETLVTKAAQVALKAISHVKLVEVEKCSLCNTVISEVAWKANSCPLGHRLPRCALSLLQVTSFDLRTCPVCGQIYHSSLDEIYDEVLCIFCDLPAIMDHRLIDTSNSKLYTRNLSKQRVASQIITDHECDDE